MANAPTTPNLVGAEKETLVAFLSYLRASIAGKAEGVSEESGRWTPYPSGKSLLSLLKHLTTMELGWFCHSYAGEDLSATPVDQRVGDNDTLESVLAAYRAATARADAAIADVDDLDAPGVRTLRPTAPERPTLRWILVHTIEDTARHTGHADMLREGIDGSSGNWRGNPSW